MFADFIHNTEDLLIIYTSLHIPPPVMNARKERCGSGAGRTAPFGRLRGDGTVAEVWLEPVNADSVVAAAHLENEVF
jgi:hypothetical protein